MRPLSGKVALVTGAAHGQGRAHALRLAHDGADVIAMDVCAQATEVGYPLGTSAELDETAAMIEAEGVRAYAGVADVRDRDALRDVLAATADAFPRLDVIVANAAVSGHSRFLEYPQDRWDAIIDINLTGTFKLLQTFIPRMVDAGNGGSIVLMSSVAGLKGIPFTAAYVSSKHAIQGLMSVLALELGEHGIRVNTLNPGAVRTPMTEDDALVALFQDNDADSALFGRSYAPLLPLPEGGFIDPATVSAAVSWLASDDARFVTGTAFPMEAGVLLR